MVYGVFASLKLVKCSHFTNSHVATVFLHVCFVPRLGHWKRKQENPKEKGLVRILVVVPMVSTGPPHEAGVTYVAWGPHSPTIHRTIMNRTDDIPVNDLQPPWRHDSVGSLRSHVDKGPRQRTGARLGSIVGRKLERLQSKSSQKGHDPPSSECSNPHHNPSVWHRPWNGATDGKWRMELVLPSRDIMTWNHNTSCCCRSEIASWNSRLLLPGMFFTKPVSNQNHPIFFRCTWYVHTNSFLVVTSSSEAPFHSQIRYTWSNPIPNPLLFVLFANVPGSRPYHLAGKFRRCPDNDQCDSHVADTAQVLTRFKHAGQWPRDLDVGAV